MNGAEDIASPETETPTRTSSRIKSVVLIVGGAAILMVGGLLFATQANSEPGCGRDAPCMLYFYTDD